MKLLLILSVIGFTSAARVLVSRAQINELKAKVRPLLEKTVDSTGAKYLIPGVLRLAFHGCLGRCDGCININRPFNKGLDVTVDALEPLMKEWPGSRADLWAIAFEVAHDLGTEINNKRCAEKYDPKTNAHYYNKCRTQGKRVLPTWVGRQDCDSGGPYYNVTFSHPDFNMDSKSLVDWFWGEMRVRSHHIVALMGAHSAGRINNRGIKRAWMHGEGDGLTFRYFGNMINFECDREWEQKKNAEGSQFYWEGINKEFALPSDLALIKDFRSYKGQFNKQNGKSNKQYHHMGGAPNGLHHESYLFASQKRNWNVDFSYLMQHILTQGYRLEKI